MGWDELCVIYFPVPLLPLQSMIHTSNHASKTDSLKTTLTDTARRTWRRLASGGSSATRFSPPLHRSGDADILTSRILMFLKRRMDVVRDGLWIWPGSGDEGRVCQRISGSSRG